MKLKKASILTKIVVIALIIYAAVTLIDLKTKIESTQEVKDMLQQQVDGKTVSNAELEYAIEHSEDVDTIIEFAKDKLGLVMPGEIIFFDSEN